MQQLSKHFKRSEFACHCGCGYDTVDAELLQVLQELREHFNQPINIVSGARCKIHNALVGGATNSQHLYAKAADIKVNSIEPSAVADYLESKYPNCYGIGRYVSWTHIDVRSGPPARWKKGVL